MEDSKIVLARRDPQKQLLAHRMRRVMTKSEAQLWEQLRNNQLAGLHFRRQQVIDGFIADFYCRAARLIVECDGAVHQDQEGYDHERDRILSAHNLRVLRFTNDTVQSNLRGVLEDIFAAASSETAKALS